MEPRLILFDVDGTLVDTAGAGRRALERAFASIFDVDGFCSTAASVPFAGRTDRQIVAGLASAIGIDAATLDARKHDLEASYVEALADELRRPDSRRRTLPGIEPLLETLQRRPGVHLGLLTGNIEPGARLKLEPFGLNRFFADGGFGSDDADRRKIARIAVEKISTRCGLPFSAAQVTVVGDTEHDIDCAHANKYRAVAIDYGWTPRATLEAARPDALLDNFLDLAAVLKALAV